jgi:hypothetical protein
LEGVITLNIAAINIAEILALAFTLITGIALTAAFGFGIIPLGFYVSRWVIEAARIQRASAIIAVCRVGAFHPHGQLKNSTTASL